MFLLSHDDTTFAIFMQVIVAQEDFGTAAHVTDLGNNEKFANPKVSSKHYQKKSLPHINSYCEA